MKLHPEVHVHTHAHTQDSESEPGLTRTILSPGESERAEGGAEEAVVTAVRQEEAQVDQQGPGAAERLRGTGQTGPGQTRLNQTEPDRTGAEPEQID